LSYKKEEKKERKKEKKKERKKERKKEGKRKKEFHTKKERVIKHRKGQKEWNTK